MLHFRQTVKAVNSQWDCCELAMSMDNEGHHYRTFYIVAGDARNPTLAECKAIADYLGYHYNKGYFYKEVL